MMKETIQAVWLDENGVCSLTHLTEVSGLSAGEVQELMAIGALMPAGQDAGAPVFTISTAVAARSARRLRDDFELDVSGMSVAIRLLQRIEALERELTGLRARHG